MVDVEQPIIAKHSKRITSPSGIPVTFVFPVFRHLVGFGGFSVEGQGSTSVAQPLHPEKQQDIYMNKGRESMEHRFQFDSSTPSLVVCHQFD